MNQHYSLARLLVLLLFLALLLMPPTEVLAQSSDVTTVTVYDRFDRPLNEIGLTLVDWEGHIANPAITFCIKLPSTTALPATITLRGAHPRLYFNLPSTAGAAGPIKTLTVTQSNVCTSANLSIFPDRDTVDESHSLSIQVQSNSGEQLLDLPVHVVDQDVSSVTSPFQVHVDFSRDQLDFFSDPTKQSITEQAAADWAYFIADMQLTPVPANTEQTWIWDPDGFNTGSYAQNSFDYTGFLLYAYSIHSSALRSGGEGSYAGGFQRRNGTELPLRRSGGYEAERDGNYNTLGWSLNMNDDDWWQATNLGNVVNDLYSIALHEIGHALIFSSAYPLSDAAQAQGYVDDATVFAYHGTNPQLDQFHHFAGERDRLSGVGAFGNEYGSDRPYGRWLITKLSLLSMQALGYQLRETSAFTPLSLQPITPPPVTAEADYSLQLPVQGGIPIYYWTIVEGTLPAGLQLNSFAGMIAGTTNAGGSFPVTVQVEEYGGDIATQTLTLMVTESTQPGDCNGDNQIDAGDLSALVLEIFDGDGSSATSAGGGDFPGTADCDANVDTQINAGDLSCTVMQIFNGTDACLQ